MKLQLEVKPVGYPVKITDNPRLTVPVVTLYGPEGDALFYNQKWSVSFTDLGSIYRKQ